MIFRQTPLHYAVNSGHLGVFEYLVDQNAYINAKDISCGSPLRVANQEGKIKVVEFLKSKGGH